MMKLAKHLFLIFLATACPFALSAEAGDSMSCPQKKEIATFCDAPENAAPASNRLFNPWKTQYTARDSCRLYHWVQDAPKWKYPPLTEWGAVVDEALREHVNPDEIYKFMQAAPMPPSPTTDRRDHSFSKCKYLDAKASEALSSRLNGLNIRQMSSHLMEDLVHSCLAFEVGTDPSERLAQSISGTYVIPFGSINIAVAGKIKFLSPREREVTDDNKDMEIYYSAFALCPVTQNPRTCIQKRLANREKPIGWGFEAGEKQTLITMPTENIVDAAYIWRAKTPLFIEVEMEINPNGNVDFRLPLESGRSRLLGLDVRDGRFNLRAYDLICQPQGYPDVPLNLRPAAFAPGIGKLVAQLDDYQESDFPPPYHIRMPASETRGCYKGQGFSSWAAETANAARHWLQHDLSPDTVYQEIASRWDMFIEDHQVADRPASNPRKHGVIAYRDQEVQEILPVDDTSETKAIRFVMSDVLAASDRSEFSKTVEVNHTAVTDVWYSRQSRWVSTEEGGFYSQTMITHLRNPTPVYRTEVLDRLSKILTTCDKENDQKKEFLTAMFALGNARLFPVGSEPVNRIFMAAMYHRIFGKPLKKIEAMTQLEIDSQTNSQSDFVAKYLPLL